MDFNNDLDDLVVFYLEANGLTEEEYVRKYELANDGINDSYISNWDLPIPIPTKEQLLALDINEVVAKKNRKQKLFKIRDNKLTILSDDELNRIKNRLPNGSLFLNSTTGRINYKLNDIIVVL
jgi:hypothetical protein